MIYLILSLQVEAIRPNTTSVTLQKQELAVWVYIYNRFSQNCTGSKSHKQAHNLQALSHHPNVMFFLPEGILLFFLVPILFPLLASLYLLIVFPFSCPIHFFSLSWGRFSVASFIFCFLSSLIYCIIFSFCSSYLHSVYSSFLSLSFFIFFILRVQPHFPLSFPPDILPCVLLPSYILSFNPCILCLFFASYLPSRFCCYYFKPTCCRNMYHKLKVKVFLLCVLGKSKGGRALASLMWKRLEFYLEKEPWVFRTYDWVQLSV